MFNKLRKNKIFKTIVLSCVLASMMAVCCFATGEGSANVTSVMDDLSTMVTGLLENATAVFGFLTSAEVLPWVLLGVGVSLVSVGIWWVKWIIWGR
jgi:hypothetical protein